MEWNSDNTKGGAAPGGLPTSQSVNQWDLSLGGRIIRDKVWFFATYRYADLQNGISRTPTGPAYLTAFKPDFRAVRQLLEEQAALRQSDDAAQRQHELSGFFQDDRNRFTSSRERNTDHVNYRSAGGSMYLGEAELGVGPAADDVVLRLLQQQGRQRRGHLQQRDRVRPAAWRSTRSRASRRGVPRATAILVTMNNVETPEPGAVVDGDPPRRPHLLP